MNPSEMNVLALAYFGDSIYECYIRKYLLEQGIVKVKQLQERAVFYVSAKGQARHLKVWMEKGWLTEYELAIVSRARNHKGTRHPKSTDIITYKHSTALEALVGYWYMTGAFARLEEMMKKITGE